MDLLETLLTLPGFVYQIGAKYYFLGKWICKPCEDMEITDTQAMYVICNDAGEFQSTALYFHKLRTYSDFALDIPYNAQKVKMDLQQLVDGLSDFQKNDLAKQIHRFSSDLERF